MKYSVPFEVHINADSREDAHEIAYGLPSILEVEGESYDLLIATDDPDNIDLVPAVDESPNQASE